MTEDVSRAHATAERVELAREIGQLVREWGLREVRPSVIERERIGEFPRDLYQQMGGLGFFGCCFPESLGGTGAGFRALAAVSENLAWVYPPLSASMNLQAATVPLTIANWGSPEQQQAWVPGLISGELLGLQRDDRAGRRLGLPRRHAHACGARRRRLRPQRRQDVDHQRQRRRRLDRLCQDRPGRRTPRSVGLRGPDQHAGLRGDARPVPRPGQADADDRGQPDRRRVPAERCSGPRARASSSR